MSFRISALKVEQFRKLFGLGQASLTQLGAQRIVAESKPGYPCRVSLRDAEIGENVLLINYEHQSASTPYRSCHAIFVREWANQAVPGIDEIPDMFKHRLLSVRAFDVAGMMIDADVVEGPYLETLIPRMLECGATDYLHIHNAKPGCYAATVRRA